MECNTGNFINVVQNEDVTLDYNLNALEEEKKFGVAAHCPHFRFPERSVCTSLNVNCSV